MKGNQKMITNDELIEKLHNNVNIDYDELLRIEDELIKNGCIPPKDLNFDSVDEINNDGPGLGTVIACFLFGWMFGD